MYQSIVRSLSLWRPAARASLTVSTSTAFPTTSNISNGVDQFTRPELGSYAIRAASTLSLGQQGSSYRSCLGLNLGQPLHNCLQRRYKKRSMKKSDRNRQQEEEEDDEDSDEDEDSAEVAEGDDTRVATASTVSMRMDAVGKITMGIARARFEEHFYSGLIRLNGERVGKKSQDLVAGDQIDLIRGFNAEQRDLLDINRVDILSIDDKATNSGRIRFVFRKTNKLTIENYKRDPYDGSLISSKGP